MSSSELTKTVKMLLEVFETLEKKVEKLEVRKEQWESSERKVGSLEREEGLEELKALEDKCTNLETENKALKAGENCSVPYYDREEDNENMEEGN
jgi:hypothetical protein